MTQRKDPQEPIGNGKFRALVGESIGAASMCWSELPRGVFDSTRAVELIGKIVAEYEALQSKLEKVEAENKKLLESFKCLEVIEKHCNEFGRVIFKRNDSSHKIIIEALKGEGE